MSRRKKSFDWLGYIKLAVAFAACMWGFIFVMQLIGYAIDGRWRVSVAGAVSSAAFCLAFALLVPVAFKGLVLAGAWIVERVRPPQTPGHR